MLKQASIKKRLTLLITSISCTSVLLTTVAVTLLGIYHLKESLVEELKETAGIVGELNQPYILFQQEDKASENLRKVFSGKSSILRACMYNASGKPAASYFNDAVNDKTCPDIQNSSDGISSIHGITTVNDKRLSIIVESDLREIDAYVTKQVVIAVMVASAISALAYLLALNMQRTISVPILKLSETARRVSIEKDYSLRAVETVSAMHDSEIVTLIGSFNAMLEEIQLRDQQALKKNEELGKAKEAAESASRAKSHFLANISHELRTPLNAIIGFSSILINELFGGLGHEKYNEYAHDINDAGVHLLDIINDILDLSKAEAGKLTLVFEEVHVQRAVNKCITILAERAAEGQVTITTDISKGLPYLVADRLRFIQIILNLLSNAVKFTQAGGTIHVSVTPIMRNNVVTDFMITIQDTGIGITRENIAKVFQSFGQIDSGLNRLYEGTGLGLPLTKKLVELHHGTISLESEPGVGTKVTVHFIANPKFINDLLIPNQV